MHSLEREFASLGAKSLSPLLRTAEASCRAFPWSDIACGDDLVPDPLSYLFRTSALVRVPGT